MKKLLILGLIALGFASCSKETLNYAERDAALNILRANKWMDVVKYVSEEGKEDTKDTLVGDDETLHLEFRANNNAYIMNTDQSFSSPIPYSMPEKKVLVFDGVTYQIQESLIGSITNFSIKNTEAGKTTTIVFKRR